ncbi:MAG TPA: hypothetical protein VHM72_02095, partial [Solirubrobacteraceae bacterium]|nr:hypothetical protein [Solirubrobacteraceae bacterium]
MSAARSDFRGVANFSAEDGVPGSSNSKVYLVGGGIPSSAAGPCDARLQSANVQILDQLSLDRGSMD